MRRPQLHEKALQPRRPAARDKAAAARVRKHYTLLFTAFGPQGWWPVTPRGGSAPVYTPGFYGPLPGSAVFEICVGAILTQNTAWTNVEKALGELSRGGLLSPEKIAACRLPRLERAIRSSGYFRQKSRRLREFCRRVLREHPEGLAAWFAAAPPGELRGELLSYSGIGPETADSMVLYGAGKASFVIDAYTRRFGERAGLGRKLDYQGWKELFEGSLEPGMKVYNEFHALLVKLGKDFCRKSRPRCAVCPLNRDCGKRV